MCCYLSPWRSWSLRQKWEYCCEVCIVWLLLFMFSLQVLGPRPVVPNHDVTPAPSLPWNQPITFVRWWSPQFGRLCVVYLVPWFNNLGLLSKLDHWIIYSQWWGDRVTTCECCTLLNLEPQQVNAVHKLDFNHSPTLLLLFNLLYTFCL